MNIFFFFVVCVISYYLLLYNIIIILLLFLFILYSFIHQSTIVIIEKLRCDRSWKTSNICKNLNRNFRDILGCYCLWQSIEVGSETSKSYLWCIYFVFCLSFSTFTFAVQIDSLNSLATTSSQTVAITSLNTALRKFNDSKALSSSMRIIMYNYM